MKKVVTNGCFDILHLGHISLLMHCRKLAGDDGEVIVLIDDDSKIRMDKGHDRPIFNTRERMITLSDIPCDNGKPLVDKTMYFYNNEQLADMIKVINPDILVKGNDWKDEVIVGAEHVKEVVFFETLKGYSTSKILDRVKNKWKDIPLNR